MIRAVCPDAVSDLKTGFVTGWNVSPNIAYTITVVPGSSSCAVWLFDAATGAYLAGGAALVGTDQPVTLLPATSPGIGMVDADLGYHLLVSTDGTEAAQTYGIGPFVDGQDQLSAIYTMDDLAVVQATAVIREGTHYTDDASIMCPLGFDGLLGDVVSATVHGASIVGDIESASFQAGPSSMADVITIRSMSAILPDAQVVIVPPTVADDTAETDASTSVTGYVLINDAAGLTVVAVGGIAANVGVAVPGSDGGVFTIAADGGWTFDPDGDFAALSGSDTAETSVTYHASDGLSEAMATLTVTVSSGAYFSFADPFDAVDPAAWDTSGLGSAQVAGGKLVTESVANTWGGVTSSAAKYKGTIPTNFDVSVSATWVGRSSDLCEIYLCCQDESSGLAYVGMVDGMAAYSSGTLCAQAGAGSWSGTAYGAGASGSAQLKIAVRGTAVSLYIDGELRLTGTITGRVTNIYLSNTRYQTYNGKTAKWDDFAIQEV